MSSSRITGVFFTLLLSSLVLAACAGSAYGFPTGKFYVSGSERTEGFDFGSNGKFSFFSANDTVMEGTYEVQGDVYTETSNTAESVAPACKQPSTYNWVYDGSTLRFTVIEDNCPDRRGAYTDYLFVK